MLKFIKMFICKFRGHELVEAGACPYTGLNYKYCLSCGGMQGYKPE